jgi:hypothetical protein
MKLHKKWQMPSKVIQTLHQKVDLSQQRANSSGKLTQGAGSSTQPQAAEKSTGDRDSPVVKNLPIKVTLQGANYSGTPPVGTSSSSKKYGVR